MKIEWKQVVVALAIGVILGAVVGGLRHRFPPKPMGEPGKKHFNHMVNRLSRQLKLTPEQKQQVVSIMEASRVKVDTLMAESRPKFEEIRASTQAEIKKILTPEQREKFDRIELRMEKRFRKRGPRPPGP
ncbi:MAG TPA: Spy/CpxP family protein refolding chaperone [Elusimicrobiota bacterium]|nr:Spy/CpxP family protein refolding chaperone [Elusimicrobiota bacterium]